jgi:DNA-binding NarL/FixJ family response regulator
MVMREGVERADMSGRSSQSFSHDGAAESGKPAQRTIVIVHPSRLFRDCLEQALVTRDIVDDVRHFGEIEQAIAALEAPRHGLLLMKQPMGPAAEIHLKRLPSLVADRLAIVLTGSCDDARTIAALLSDGIRGYIPSSLDLSVTIQALCLVLAGGTYVPPDYLLKLYQSVGAETEKKDDEVFTAKQLAVIEAIRHGKPNKTIAYDLNMCEGTVKVHVRHIMKKLRARNRTQVAYYANLMAQDSQGDDLA